MKAIGTEQLLQQIRALQAQLEAPLAPRAPEPGQTGFGDLLKQSIDAVNDLQQGASALKQEFEAGKSDVSLVQVMVAAQKADLSFRAMTEVRNKLVAAYQEIMNMPV
ncbi:MAG TPA: flagellar hook-basal body complex protein FliE [Woeseiaceae bacterium]|nr:flagellar hook-basal body complex protein FliE [Woeseiaceae bacterium]